MTRKTYSLGVDVGGTNTLFGLVDGNGKVKVKESVLTKSFISPDLLFENIFSKVIAWEEEFGYANIIHKIGVGVPNGNYYRGMSVNPPNLPDSWNKKDLVHLIKTFRNIHVIISNDANAAAIGEKNYGKAKNMSNVVIITLGTGLGSGLIINKKIYYGHDGFAGELGHLVIQPNGRACECGLNGCLEMYVSAKGLKITVEKLLKQYPKSDFLIRLKENNINGKLIDIAFDNKEKLASKIYSYTGKMLGIGLAMISTILSPEAFIFYGGLSKAGYRLFDFAEKSMNNNLLSFQKNKIKIMSSAMLDGEAGIIGASCLE